MCWELSDKNKFLQKAVSSRWLRHTALPAKTDSSGQGMEHKGCIVATNPPPNSSTSVMQAT